MIQSKHKLSKSRQCELLSLNRSSLYYQPRPESSENLRLMRIIDEQFLKTPYYGSRQMMRHLVREGHNVGRHRVRCLMRLMGIEAIYQKPKTSIPNADHKIYPYLLRDLNITYPGQVWCTDITYIPIRRGFFYLIAIMDWYSRAVLSWDFSNRMDVSFCTNALEEAVETHPHPEIFNSDQGSQFTSNDFTKVLQKNQIKISMDGKGRWMDNVFIERLWRSLKYECVYLNDFENGHEARQSIAAWIRHYNTTRPHSVFDGQTPNEVYLQHQIRNKLAA